jgi:hypothetical protein
MRPRAEESRNYFEAYDKRLTPEIRGFVNGSTNIGYLVGRDSTNIFKQEMTLTEGGLLEIRTDGIDRLRMSVRRDKR